MTSFISLLRHLWILLKQQELSERRVRQKHGQESIQSREVTSAAILIKLESSKLAALLGLDERPVRLVLMVSPVHLVSPVRPTLPAQHSTQGEQESEMILPSYLTAVLERDGVLKHYSSDEDMFAPTVIIIDLD